MLPQRVESRRRLDDSLQLNGSTGDFYCGSLTKRRDTIHVIQDILSLGKEGVSRTQVIQKANLSFSLAMRYIPFLLSKGHLEQGIDGRGARLIPRSYFAVKCAPMRPRGLRVLV